MSGVVQHQFGIDYGSIDGNMSPNAEAVKNGKCISFVQQRGSFTMGGKAFTDTHLGRDRDAWHAAGVVFGGYAILGWAKNGPTPEDQMAKFIEAYGDRRKGELPPALDLEADSAQRLGMSYAECVAWAERAYKVLVAKYGTVIIYTSRRVWIEVFGGLLSIMQGAPLWDKVAYPYAPGQPVHLEATGILTVPDHWPNAWEIQFQGDARGILSNTTDVSYWRIYVTDIDDTRTPSIILQLKARGYDTGDNSTSAVHAAIVKFQGDNGLTADGAIGVSTFAYLY